MIANGRADLDFLPARFGNLAGIDIWSTAPVSDDPASLLPKLLDLARRAGITRLGDLTGLDRIGLPVVQTVRPEALSEVTGLGRGATLGVAAVGAIMETLEKYYAERIDLGRVFSASADELAVLGDLFDGWVEPSCRRSWRNIPVPWIEAIDLAGGDTQPVPFELIHACYVEPPPAGGGIFLKSTTGLACHTDAPAAILHGLLECVERDAIARAFQTHGFFDRRRIVLNRATLATLLDQGDIDGLEIAFWHAPSPTGIPVVWCQAIEVGPVPTLALATEGFAAGLTLHSAMSTAMLEALANRPSAIAGTRDDLTQQHYGARSRSALRANAVSLICDTPAEVQVEAIEDCHAKSLEALVGYVAAGLGPVLCASVGADAATSVQCVRVLLPRAMPLTVVR